MFSGGPGQVGFVSLWIGNFKGKAEAAKQFAAER
jgi:hypothetical protein